MNLREYNRKEFAKICVDKRINREGDMDEPWYVKLFDEDYLRYYTAGLTPELTHKEVDFILARLALEPGAKILDLCCGHGRHAIELARRGLTVTGQDLSAAALARARENARQDAVEVRWVQADMRQIPDGEFDADQLDHRFRLPGKR
jgi:ubiquinone/menaquinone biosynthesis C-methylase UbiE